MTLRFTLRQLEYFVAVGEEGSIAKASERVNVSSPSISAAVTQLEDEFDIPLFVRKHAHGLTLTQAGRQFMVQAQRVLHEADAMYKLATKISGNVQGPLRVGCLLTFAQMLVPGLRRAFEEQFPLVQVKQYELDQLDIFDRLRQAEIDLALTYDLDIPSDFKFVPLFELPPFAMMNETHSLAHLSAVSIDELQEYPMVMLNLPHSVDYFLSFFTAIGVEPNIMERTRDMAVLRSLVANGFGYSIANLRPLNDLSPDGRPLKFIPLTGPVRSLNIGIVMIDGADHTLTVDAFVQHCRTYVQTSEIVGANSKRNS